jgi:hypothetical protein
VPEPPSKRSDADGPAVPQPVKGGGKSQTGPAARPIPVAKRLEATEKESAPPKASPAAPKSYRVRELPPPPVVVSPESPGADAVDGPPHDTLPDVLSTPPEKLPEEPIPLDALQISSPARLGFLRQHVRIPPRWEQWLADVKRRNKVGVALSVAIHVVFFVVLALLLRSPASTPAMEPIQARVVQSSGELITTQPLHAAPLREPLVRQETPGLLETLVLDPPLDSTLDRESKPTGNASATRSVATPPAVKLVDPTIAAQAGVAANPAAANAAASPESVVPGMATGSQVPPDLLQAVDAMMQGKLNRRTPSGRPEGIRYGGGTTQSEEAVERALRWIAAHQRPDGSWSFNHLSDACQHYCTHPGSEASTTAATGMALLPFLGAGYTHRDGEYQAVVQAGLDYLKKRGLKISYGTDLRDGSMYGHALATIALCEAFGMTHDEDLKAAAQGGLDYIGYVQDLNTGGWRYNPGESGDTTVTGWMLMALKSGQMARLNVQSPAIFSAQRFLNSVQNQDGSQYGYQSRKPRAATTAVGLLCRMYTGWRRDNPGLIKGIDHLKAWGPSDDCLYYDYYATQVLFHWGGPEWDAWNRKLREHLISRQETAGHPTGSWYFESQQSGAGGRLYNTAMAAMILEVYYRFMPLYGEEAIRQR